MNSWARKSLKVGALSAGFLLAGAAAAHADATTSNNAGIGNGTQVDAQIQAPIDVCGNAVALFGNAYAGCTGGAWATNNGELGDLRSSDNFGILNGTQVRALVQAPIDVCGNAVGIGGTAAAWCTGGSWATIQPGGKKGKPDHGGYYTKQESRTESYGGYGGGHGGPTLVSTQNYGILNGTQVLAPIQIPINVCGNAIGILGDATASCVGGASASLEGDALPSAWTGLNFGIGNGTQLLPLIQIPVNICGNAVAVLGDASASCKGGADAVIGKPGHEKPDYYAPVADKPGKVKGKKHVKRDKTEGLPLVGQLTGLAGGVSGLTDTVAGLTDGVVASASRSQVSGLTDGLVGNGLLGGDLLGGATGGLLGGSPMSVLAPTGADRASILPAAADRKVKHGMPKHGKGGSCSATSSMNFGILNGTQAIVPVQAPVDISGNAISVGGNATAGSTGGATATLTC
ncbi:MAG: DUF320 domain-containing protein [Hamadaea sp.]|nr:DUF320 domain-containing protein [Hamadaea sp.]